MQRLIPVVLAAAAAAAGAQARPSPPGPVRHLRTSLNHLTVLELGEPVTTLAVGDRESFSIERHDDKVFVMPLHEGVATDLFVWTASRELIYELDPAGREEGMDVAVRALPEASRPAPSPEPSPDEARRTATTILTQAMMEAEDIVREPERRAPGRVAVTLEQILRTADRIYIRFTVVNATGSPFRLTAPEISLPLPARHPVSLPSLRDHQIAARTFAAFRAQPGWSAPGVESESAARNLGPGERTAGVVSLPRPAGDPPRLYELDFGADAFGPLRVAAVL